MTFNRKSLEQETLDRVDQLIDAERSAKTSVIGHHPRFNMSDFMSAAEPVIEELKDKYTTREEAEPPIMELINYFNKKYLDQYPITLIDTMAQFKQELALLEINTEEERLALIGVMEIVDNQEPTFDDVIGLGSEVVRLMKAFGYKDPRSEYLHDILSLSSYVMMHSSLEKKNEGAQDETPAPKI